jgi:general secretion pathway protein K
VALVMVLGAITVMTVMLAEFQDDASAEFAAATAARDSVKAEYLARSAVNLSRLLIASEPAMRQAIAPLFMLMKRTAPQIPIWVYADRFLGMFNDKEGAKDFAALSGLDLTNTKNLGVQDGRFEIVIVDEDSKINVNQGASNTIAHLRLAQQIMSTIGPIRFDPLFARRDVQGNTNDRLTTCAAIIDWADSDDQLYSCDLTATPSSNAVEDGYYQLLPKPYRRKNAPYDSLEELHMVRGVDDDFWATFVDPDPTNPTKRNMTVWGQGTINVNTANAATLLALVCSGAVQGTELCTDPAQMQMFLSGVVMAQGLSMGAPIFGGPNEFIATVKGQGMLGPLLTALGMKPVKFSSEADFAKSVSTESKVFSVYAVGVVKGFRRETRVREHVVVDFRSAPSLLNMAAAVGSASGSSSASSSGSSAASGSGSSSADSNAIASALSQAVGGQILFHSIE